MTTDAPTLTKNQNLVFETLSEAQIPLSAYTILDRLRDAGFRAPLQVYRALEKLRDYGLVHRLESVNAFVACRHSNCHGTGLISFAICRCCDHVEEFADDVVTNRLTSWTNARDFKVEQTTIEISGLCGRCAVGAKSED